MTKASLNVKDVSRVSELASAINKDEFTEAGTLEEFKRFSIHFSLDITKKGIALLSLRSQLSESASASISNSKILKKVDREQEPVLSSFEFKGGILEYGARSLIDEAGIDHKNVC
ncbi:hypothetical protein QT397_17040 [Microbulbifer sp. MKSA007]|nr:hypothetical protein QT397_17040 [Microbulbifer sp. MKSA007]